MGASNEGKVSRRGMLAAGVAGAALAGGKALAQQDKAEKPSKPPELEEPVTETLSPRLVACAEKMIPIHYTDKERAQLLHGFENQLRAIATLRAQHFSHDLAPALTFDPRPPGKAFAKQKNRVRVSRPPAGQTAVSGGDLAYASLSELGHQLRKGHISSVALTKLYLKRIRRYGDALECFVTVTPELALAEAAEADAKLAKGEDLGPLHGIPYGIKDLFDTKGIRTTWGAMPYKDRVPDSDSRVVTRLRQAGAVLLGKTTCGAIAYGDIWFGGKTRNPWNTAEGSSGSSAGSASATAAGLVGFSIGTETLGSIVSPSNRCGATGLRPTFGRVSRAGAMALCWSLDKAGTICRHVEDTALVLGAINGYDAADASSIGMGFEYAPGLGQKDLLVGYDPAWFAGKSGNEIDRHALKTLQGLGVQTRHVSLPELPYGVLFLSLVAEAAAAFEELTLSGRDDLLVWQADNAWPNSWRQIRFLSSVDYVQLDRLRRKVMGVMDKIMDEVDVLITPNFAANLLTITNYTGHPCLTLRAGFHDVPTRGGDANADKTPHRVPQNISLIGRLFEEGKLCALGRRLEAALGVANERPPHF